MPAASKVAPANELFMDEEVPNARLKSGKTIVSTCKLFGTKEQCAFKKKWN